MVEDDVLFTSKFEPVTIITNVIFITGHMLLLLQRLFTDRRGFITQWAVI